MVSAQLEEPFRSWQDVKAFDWAGVPLVAPQIRGHQLVDAEVRYGDQEEGQDGSAILLAYEGESDLPQHDWSEIQVFVRQVSAATPEAACSKPYAALRREADGGRCRSVADDQWVRQDLGETAVFARHGNALIQLASETVSETMLFSALRDLRPVSAVDLAGI